MQERTLWDVKDELVKLDEEARAKRVRLLVRVAAGSLLLVGIIASKIS